MDTPARRRACSTATSRDVSPRLRKFALTAHIVSSVGWLGAVVTFLALAIIGLVSHDADLVRGIYLAAEPLTWFVIVPFAIASLSTGVIQSLGTQWGLLRHYWVLFKLVIAVFAGIVLLMYTQTVGSFADAAAAGARLGELRAPTFVLHSSAALLLLLTTTALAVYKPRGTTRFASRR